MKTTAIAITVLILGAVHQSPAAMPGTRQSTPQTYDTGKWNGTASCVITSPDGKTKTISASCLGAISREDAKSKLTLSIQQQVQSSGGKQTGTTSFSISISTK